MSKEGYFKKYFDDNKKDTKKVWSAIRSIVNVKQTNRYQQSNLIIENKTVSNLSTIANNFNYFFTKNAGEADRTTGPRNKTPNDYLCNPNKDSFYLSPTCKEDIEDIISTVRTDKTAFQQEYLKISKRSYLNPLVMLLILASHMEYFQIQ